MARVLYIHGTTRPGGAWHSLTDILLNLDGTRFEPVLACSKPPAVNGLQDNVPIVQVRMPMWRKGKNLPRIPVAIRGLRAALRRNRIDLVHANSIWDVPYAVWAARGPKLPVIAHIRTEVDARVLAKYMIRKADAVVATSSKIARAVSEAVGAGVKVYLLPNGVDLGRYDPGACDGRRVRSEHGLSPDETVFGIIGRIDRLKGHEDLVAAFAAVVARIPSAKLMVVGDSFGKGSEFKEQLFSYVQALGLGENVIFAGYRTEVAPYLAAIDVLVVPSKKEGFGRSAVEAMAMAKPVIAYASGGLDETVRDGKTGLLVAKGDVAGLSARMLELAGDTEMRQRLGRAGRKVVEEHYELGKIIQKLEAIYSQVLGESAGTV